MNFLKRVYNAFDERAGITEMLGPILRHPVPRGTDWWYVFGSATLLAFIIQIVTGVILATMYIPSTEHAYQSIKFITDQATLGRLLRGIHFFSASAMIALVAIHAIRVFLMASYKYPREVNWLSGVFLLFLTLGMGFTGQLLRWDENAYYAIIVGAEQAGRLPFIGKYLADFLIAGKTIGGSTLTRFYSFHIFLIPATMFAILGLHLYLVLRNGISEPPKPGQIVDPKTYRGWYKKLLDREGIPFWPYVIWRDIAFGALVAIAVVALALIFGPPKLSTPPDPTIINTNPRPDWYLLWYFAVLALIPPATENYVMIGAPLVAALVMFLLPFLSNKGERSPLRRPWAPVIVLLLLISFGALLVQGYKSPWSPDFNAKPLPASVVNSTHPDIVQGASLFYQKGCEYCHEISGYGGHRGPVLTTVGDRLTRDEMIIQILNGGGNMPAFANIITPDELNLIVDFLQTRTGP
jgi:ubiquinol-cytochrome c reductase cytochrome b subunit